MPVSVEIPDIGEVEFPDSMAAEDIASASKRLYSERRPQPPFQAPRAAPFSPGRENPELGLYTPRVDPQFQIRPIPNTGLAPLTQPLVAIGDMFTIGEQIQRMGEPRVRVGDYPNQVPVSTSSIPALQIVGGAVKGVENVAANTINFMLSPAGLATLGLSSAPGIVRSVVSAGFAADMASHAPDAYQKFEEARLKGDAPGQAQAITEGLATLAGAGLAGSHSYAQARKFITEGRFGEKLPPLTAEELKIETEPTPQAKPGDIIRETPAPPQQQGTAPIEAPVAPETVAPTRPAVEGQVREPVAAIPEQPVKAAEAVPQKPKREFSQREQDKIDDALSDAEVTANEILERDPAYQKEQSRVTAFEEEIADMEKIAADRNNPDRKSAASRVNELEVDLEQIQKGIQRMRERTLATERQKAWGTVMAKLTPEEAPAPSTPKTVEAAPPPSTEPAISFPGIGSLREKQATAMELGKIRKNEPELWKAITQMFGTDKPAQIAKLAKQRMEESKTPPPDVEQRAMLSGSHIAGIPDPISLAFAVTFGTKTGREMVGEATRFYSEPLAERIATEGGPQSKAFGGMAREIAQRAKQLYGSLTDVLDPALQEMGKLNRTTTWLNDMAPTKKRWGFRNAQAAAEGPIENVPPQYRAVVELLKSANLRIGQLAERVVAGFKATGRYQRPPTDFLIDTIRAGQGQAFDVVKNALAAENKIHPEKVKKILLGIKEELDAPGSEQTVHRIAQEFERHFKKFPTDIRITTPLGEVWMPILHARPFEYLQNAATRTAQRVAFLERVPKDSLPELRKSVVSELKSPEAFDDLVRALHGLPVNQPLRLFTPGSLQSMIAQGANRVLTDVFGSLKLTASAIYNIPETVLGNTPAFFGWRNFARGAIGLKERWKELENIGAINRAIYNFSFDPKAPVRSVLSQFRQGVRKATMQQFFNEMQEMLAASTAQVFAERAQGKELSPREQGLFTETAVAMGYTRPAARAMAEGRGTTEQYGSFTRRAAAFATGGNIQPAEMSRFGGNRVLTSLFRFQSYPIMKLNAFRKAYTNFTDAVESKDPRRIKASSEQLAKFLFNTTAQGAAATFLAALLTGRGGGVQQTLEEVEENPAKFILDSVMGGMGGPVSAINYAIGTGKARDLVDPRKINAGVTFPGSIYLELKQLFNTEGPYAGMTLPNAVQKYIETRVPVGKMIRHAFEEAGLASKGASTSNTIYRIHQDWLKRHPDEAVREDYQRNLDLTTPESKYSAVYAAIRARDLNGLQKAIEDLESKGTDIKAIKQAIKTNLQPGKRVFHGKQELEQDFVESLTPAQRKLYESALDERQEQWDFLDGNF